MGGRARRVAIGMVFAAFGCAVAVGCSLTTNLDGLSGGGPGPGGAVDADANVGSEEPEEGARSGDADVDATLPPDSGAAHVVFADSFDDATPLPRAWDSMAGLDSPTLQMLADAPSPPGVLSIFENGPTAPETYLRKTVAVPSGTVALTCGLKMKATDLPNSNSASLITMDLGAGRYVRIDVVTSRWKLYGQFPNFPDISATSARSMVDAWIALQIRVETGGRIIVSVDSDVHAVSTSPFSFDHVELDVGVRLPNPTTSSLDLKIDDVGCAAE